ncbi:hypothetical protein BRADI_2g46805v3 [Brachypodium distachyon]|uniref:Uncharacterized protein n=1 Tax=Brachypodium distachyon TaxID=15368 RepID=A0A2K2DEC6_BRADI|nr:hypothetical protein BRADI_2g46805v3 [Brachypodium distachyon]
MRAEESSHDTSGRESQASCCMFEIPWFDFDSFNLVVAGFSLTVTVCRFRDFCSLHLRVTCTCNMKCRVRLVSGPSVQ